MGAADELQAAAYRAQSAVRIAYRALVAAALAGDEEAAAALRARWEPLRQAGPIRTEDEAHEQADARTRQVANL